MKELFNLGELYVSDFLNESDEPRGGKVEMKMMLDETTGNVRLEKTAPLDVMYGKYWYRSGINQSMKNELQRIVTSILDVKQLKENDIWVDNTKDAYEMTYRECENTKTTLLNTYTSEEITEVFNMFKSKPMSREEKKELLNLLKK